eukprot:TRINITY_DN4757_c0_g1_i5.p1 TRINITY_DN4757_c0_g1~~TRINITY_DN4757_c0_g1_i5.p1  ORF type:complete len:314 (-),score=30.21 TRINITY_DN4757_c0_g1_i5:1451-2392(-)
MIPPVINFVHDTLNLPYYRGVLTQTKSQLQHQYENQLQDLFSKLSNSQWITRMYIDVCAASIAAFTASPFITIVDKSIVENASGKRKLIDSIIHSVKELMTRPWKFCQRREMWMIFGVYSTIYIAANTMESIESSQGMDMATTKLFSVAAASTIASIFKDSAYVQMFGTKPPSPLPLASYAAFFVRDTLTIGAAFNLPKTVALNAQQQSGWSQSTCYTVAQLTCPMAAQFAITPWHLLALDFYNRPEQRSWLGRADLIRREMWKSTVMRMCRIFPAYGVCGLSNKYLRQKLEAQFLGNENLNKQQECETLNLR